MKKGKGTFQGLASAKSGIANFLKCPRFDRRPLMASIVRG